MSDLPDENKTGATLAQDGTQKPPSGTITTGGVAAKEQKEILGKLYPEGEETAKIVEVGKTPEIKEKGLETWVERLERGEEVTLPQPIRDDKGQVLVEPAAPQKPKIILPLTKEEVKKGLHHQVVDSIRWLAEWCMKLFKMTRGKLEFASKNKDA